MKIAYTISGLFNSGGMENILIQKANYLSDVLGYDISIITTDQGKKKPFFQLSHNVKLIDLGINYVKAKKSKLWHLRKFFLKRIHKNRLEAVLKKYKFDIVISLMDFDFTFLYNIRDGSKKIIEFHFEKYYKVNATHITLKKILQRYRANQWDKIVSRFDKFVVLTNEDRRRWKADNIHVIPNFVYEIPREKSQLENRKVLSVGRADFQKGFDMLINAWALVIKEFPDWKLNIIGGGDKADLQNQIDKLSMNEYISLLPPNPDLSSEYLSSSLYVLSSRYEGLPLVLIEAMAYGLPIVSFECPCGPKDILKSDFSTLVDRNDIDKLAEAIKFWLKDDARRKKAGIESRKESLRYSKDIIMKEWDSLFKSFSKE